LWHSLLEGLLVEYSLRPAVEKDFPGIKSLIHAAGINPTGLNWRRFVVAETADGQFAGCGQLKPHFDGTLELASIAVIPSVRKKGLGSMIIRRLLRTASRPLYLTCREQLGPFYQKYGFRIAGNDELPRYFGRISRLAGLLNSIHIVREKMLVMVLD
jgi:N-acetylglutamate synthase-like GNAT family acetyltransferase